MEFPVLRNVAIVSDEILRHVQNFGKAKPSAIL